MYFCQMKQTIILSIGLLLFASCNKVPKCWDCTRTVKYPSNYQPTAPEISKFEVCDKTKSEIKELEKSATIISTKVNTVSVVTECH